MNNSKMNFASTLDSATQYNLVCTNNSTTDWVFYVYQTMPSQPSDIFSLAWFASPYKISVGSAITFTWGIDYSFVWGQTGTVTPGVLFSASGIKPCSLTGPNMTTFSPNSEPPFSPVITGGQAGSLTINEAPDVPNGVFGTGIGMSGYATLVQQAFANTTQVYTSTPKYWIAAAAQMQMGQVLTQTVDQAVSFNFPPKVHSLQATLNPDNTWVIS